MKILIHLTRGPENPTVASLAFLIGKMAVEQGHTVNIFLAGDAVQLVRASILDNLEGLGTGKLKEHFDVLTSGGGKIFLSIMSSKARGVTQEDLHGNQMELVMPSVLLQLALESDKMFVY
jgi:uncharacterized protein